MEAPERIAGDSEDSKISREITQGKRSREKGQEKKIKKSLDKNKIRAKIVLLLKTIEARIMAEQVKEKLLASENPGAIFVSAPLNRPCSAKKEVLSKVGRGRYYIRKTVFKGKQKRQCVFCNKDFLVYPSQPRKFCNRICARKQQTKIGTHFITCKVCEKSFQDRISAEHKFCSRKCYLIFSIGKNTPNWHGGPKTQLCQYCKKPFLLNKSYHRPGITKYCSKKCKDIAVGINQRKRIQKKCPVCGKFFESSLIHSQVRKTCSYKCIGEYYKITGKRKAKNNSAWKGGISKEPYSFDFTEELKEEIRKQDNYECQICHITEEEHLIVYGRKQPVHHIDYNKQNCKKNNLKTLCNQCNSRVNFNREYWKEYFSVRITIKAENIQSIR